jgi:DnaJ-class molecular chaperone
MLGVNENATKEEIRLAFKKKIKQYHPDVCKDLSQKEATKMTTDLILAYETLTDDNLRDEYDSTLDIIRTAKENDDKKPKTSKNDSQPNYYEFYKSNIDDIFSKIFEKYNAENLNEFLNIKYKMFYTYKHINDYFKDFINQYKTF